MPTIKMLQTTADGEHGRMWEGDVIDVADADADRLIRLGVAEKTKDEPFRREQADAAAQAQPAEGNYDSVISRSDVQGTPAPEPKPLNRK